jgi:hypothetical protein
MHARVGAQVRTPALCAESRDADSDADADADADGLAQPSYAFMGWPFSMRMRRSDERIS